MPPTMQASQTDILSTLGRNQGREQFFDQPFSGVVAQNFLIPNSLLINRPLHGIDVTIRYRVVIAGGNYTSVNAEAPVTLLRRVRLTGTHRLFKAIVPIDMKGEEAFLWAKLFRNGHASSTYINGVLQPDPASPYAQIGATFGNTGTYDVETHYYIPLTPVLNSAAKLSTIPFLYFQRDWADTVRLQLFFGFGTAAGGGADDFGIAAAATTVAFSGFGGGGSPLATISLDYDILGALEGGVASATVVRSSQPGQNVAGITGPLNRILQLQKEKTANVLVRAGILDTFGHYASFSDNILEQTSLRADNKPVRNVQYNFEVKEHAAYQFQVNPIQGHLLHTFVDSGNPLTVYRGDRVSGGSTFELDSQVLTATANQGVDVIQEVYLGNPGGV